ncbi:MAG: nitroreductase family protein [Elusimicrobia bacterium CG08_land_8_20_14_0_20_51_18]|nr:MAG: nitroreductase family protein [Elusimicrobia bacterium CG08_land_8_20_14_0_20_51_18]
MDIIEGIKERRSINYFDRDREVSDDKIKELLELSRLTPSSLNLQPWEVLIVKSREKKKILRECAMNQPKVEEASAVAVIIADPEACEKNIDKVTESWVKLGYMDRKTGDFYKTLPAKLYGEPDSPKRKLFAVKNAAFFAMSLMLSARGLGLETHPMDGFDENCVKEKFGIAAGKVIPVIIGLGYLSPTARLLPRAYRKEVEEFSKIV